MGKGKNHSSKRVTLHQKYKIQKKVREHHRKLRKVEKLKAKKLGVKVKELKRKDPGIPNNWPFKEQLLREVEEHKEQTAQEKLRQAQERKRAREKRKKLSLSKGEVAEPIAKKDVSTKIRHDPKNPRTFFYHGLDDIIDSADIFLVVVDARDPLGCRPIEVERHIRDRKPECTIILILNKIDLAPKDAVSSWVKILSLELPTVAISCPGAHKPISDAASSATASIPSDTPSQAPAGVEHLLRLLAAAAVTMHEVKPGRPPLAVGVLGFPNLGKRSLIAALLAARAPEFLRAVPAGAAAARGAQLDRRLRLLERPGQVLAKDESGAWPSLRGVVKFRGPLDPLPAAAEVARRFDRMALMRTYKIAKFDDADDFLDQVPFPDHAKARKIIYVVKE